MNEIISACLSIIISIIIFYALHLFIKKCRSKIRNHDMNIVMEHYLPKEEAENIKQLAYLFIIFLCLVNIFFILCSLDLLDIFHFFGQELDSLLFFAVDIILSLFLSFTLDLKKDLKNKILFLLLVPYESIDLLMWVLIIIYLPSAPPEIFMNVTSSLIFNIIHLFVFLYFIRRYYIKFLNYTRNNQLGLTILLLTTLLFVTFVITIITENVTVLESINMVSNAFASNGYVVSGTTPLGIINETLIVWGGYIFSGVATATLTATILIKHFESKFKHYGDMNERFDKLKEMIEDEDLYD